MAKAIAREEPQDRRLQGQDRAGTSHPHAAQPPQILRFLVVSTGSVSAQTSRGRAGPDWVNSQAWLRFLPSLAWVHPQKEEQESTGFKAINLNSYTGSQRTR